MSNTFNFTDGKTVSFDKFKIQANQVIHVAQPAKRPGAYTHTTTVYVNKDVFDFTETMRRSYTRAATRNEKTIPLLDNLQVGVTTQKLDIGIPAGVYVPMRWNQYNGRYEISTETLENDTLILDDTVASQETRDKVYGKKEEDDADIPAVAAV